MAALTATNQPARHVVGDLVVRFYTLSGNNGDTFTPPGEVNIQAYTFTPTTAISVGITLSNGVLTLVTAGAWAGQLQLWVKAG